MKNFLLLISALFITNIAAAQFTLKGKVTDLQGNPLAGVSVREKEQLTEPRQIIPEIILLNVARKMQPSFLLFGLHKSGNTIKWSRNP